MTDGNPRPDQEPTPPASTQWSHQAETASGDDDEGLAPPFVPDGTVEPMAESAPPEAAAEEPAAEGPAPAEPTTPEPMDPEAGPADASEPEEDPFPFEAGWDEEEKDPAGAGEAGDEFPVDAFDIEGEDEEVEEAAGPDDSAESAEPAEPVEPVEPAEPVEPVERSPWDVGPGIRPTADEEPPADARQPSEAGGAAEQTAAADLAARLEDMAARLRDRGVEAAEVQMSSPDRFTALLAGLLAGYLSGRE